jgi:catechol 2,3-dioxygenase-like lactoylglutathione lyase family enzyme
VQPDRYKPATAQANSAGKHQLRRLLASVSCMDGESIMKKSLAALCGILLTIPLALSADGAALLRASLIVDNAERSLEFYSLLGYRVESDNTSTRNPVGNFFPLNAPATRTRLVILAASPSGGKIGLVEFSQPTPAEARRDPARTGRGDVVLVFDVADAEALHARLTTAGANIIEPPQTYTSRLRSPECAVMRGKVFHVWDPDNYLVELLEAPSCSE